MEQCGLEVLNNGFNGLAKCFTSISHLFLLLFAIGFKNCSMKILLQLLMWTEGKLSCFFLFLFLLKVEVDFETPTTILLQ